MNSSDLTFQGLGKRKTSVAKAFLKKGSGKITVNKLSFEKFFAGVTEEKELLKGPLLELKVENDYDIDLFLKGGGVNSQIEAARLGIAKSLCEISPEFRQILSQKGFLNRDSRIKERRKYGLKKARKAPQYSKR